jgi:hypothetical protein
MAESFSISLISSLNHQQKVMVLSQGWLCPCGTSGSIWGWPWLSQLVKNCYRPLLGRGRESGKLPMMPDTPSVQITSVLSGTGLRLESPRLHGLGDHLTGLSILQMIHPTTDLCSSWWQILGQWRNSESFHVCLHRFHKAARLDRAHCFNSLGNGGTTQ